MLMGSGTGTPEQRVDSVGFINPQIIVIGSQSGRIAALDATTGTLLWSKDFAPNMIDEVSLLGDVIYVGQHVSPSVNGDQPATLMALDAHDGATLWGVAASGLAGNVHVSVDGAIAIAAGDMGDGTIIGAEARTGEVVWSSDANAGVVNRMITAKRGIVYAWEGGFPPRFVALETGAGSFLWRYASRADVVVVSDDGQFVAVLAMTPSRDASLMLLDASDGVQLAAAPLQRGDNLLALTNEGVAYLRHAGDVPAQLSAFDLKRQVEVWRTGSDTVPSAHDIIYSFQLVVAARSVYYLQHFQHEEIIEVGALDAHTGTQLWQSPLAARQPLTINAARLVGGLDMSTIYLATDTGLRAFHADDGRLLWHAFPGEDLSFVTPTTLAPRWGSRTN